LAKARLVALVATRGALDSVAETLRLLGPEESFLALVSGSNRFVAMGASVSDARDILLGGASRGDIVALIAQGAVCSDSHFFLKSGEYSYLLVCSLYPLAKQAIVTGQPPIPSRRIPEAVLYAYTARLVRDGASAERLVTKIAYSAEGLGAGALVWEKRGKSPRVYLATSGNTRICTRHLGPAALAWLTRGDSECFQRAVLRLELLRRSPRIIIRELEKVLYD